MEKKKAEGSIRPLDEEAVRQIGTKLRREYDTVASEPVPSRFLDLLEQLEQAETRSKGSNA